MMVLHIACSMVTSKYRSTPNYDYDNDPDCYMYMDTNSDVTDIYQAKMI